jgi:lipopolysaccharide export system permease protein
MSVYLVAAFTMINPRYQSNNTFLVIFGTIILFYTLASSLQKWGTFPMLVAAIVFVSILGRWLFQVRVARYF